MRTKLLPALGLALAISALPATANAQRVYDDGSVVVESYVRTKPGMFNQYMSYLQSTWGPLMEARKQAGIISAYQIQSTLDQRAVADYNLVLVTVYPNMAAFDGLDERDEPIMERMGNMAQRDQSAASRESMREIVGSRMFRVLNLR